MTTAITIAATTTPATVARTARYWTDVEPGTAHSSVERRRIEKHGVYTHTYMAEGENEGHQLHYHPKPGQGKEGWVAQASCWEIVNEMAHQHHFWRKAPTNHVPHRF